MSGRVLARYSGVASHMGGQGFCTPAPRGLPIGLTPDFSLHSDALQWQKLNSFQRADTNKEWRTGQEWEDGARIEEFTSTENT